MKRFFSPNLRFELLYEAPPGFNKAQCSRKNSVGLKKGNLKYDIHDMISLNYIL